MTAWSITKSWPIEPPTGADFDAAYMVRLADAAGGTHDLIVEFAAPSAVASVGYAEEVARRFRRDSRLPQHVVVDVERNVRVAGVDLGDSPDGPADA